MTIRELLKIAYAEEAKANAADDACVEHPFEICEEHYEPFLGSLKEMEIEHDLPPHFFEIMDEPGVKEWTFTDG